MATTDRPLRVSLYRPSEVFAEVLRSRFAEQPTIVVVGTAAGVDELRAQLADEPSDLLLIDATGWSAERPERVAELSAAAPGLSLLVAGPAPRDELLLRFVEAGANGYVGSDASLEELVAAILEVGRGRTPCTPRVAGLIGDRLRHLGRELRRGRSAGPFRLTPREREILALIVEELSNKEIAKRAQVAVHTVKTHVHNIYHKLGVSNRREARQLAFQHDLV